MCFGCRRKQCSALSQDCCFWTAGAIKVTQETLHTANGNISPLPDIHSTHFCKEGKLLPLGMENLPQTYFVSFKQASIKSCFDLLVFFMIMLFWHPHKSVLQHRMLKSHKLTGSRILFEGCFKVFSTFTRICVQRVLTVPHHRASA